MFSFSLMAAQVGIAHAASRGLTAVQRSRVDALLRDAMKKQRIPGLAIRIAVSGKAIYSNGFGERSSGKPVDAATIFPIGSITKQFTAACVMLLAEQNRVNLDASVSDYVPSAPHGKEVTVRELLDQTSGLLDYSRQPALQKAVEGDKLRRLTTNQLISMIAGEPLQFRPGTKFDYSNTNYVLAGMVVEAASGETLKHFLNDHIFAALALGRMQYLDTSIPSGSDVARGYVIKNGQMKMEPPFTMSWAERLTDVQSDAPENVVISVRVSELWKSSGETA